MTTDEFAQAYLENEANISNILHGLHIFDMDLLHDTYIALYDHSQHADILNFTNTFVSFYRARHKRRGTYESHYEPCDNTQILNYDRPDESNLEYREQVGRRVDSLLRYYVSHPQPGERNHKRACQILQMYINGLSNVEIAKNLNIDESSVRRHLQRIIKRLKGPSKLAI